MEGGGRRTSKRGASNFSVTCRKLSHYIKQNRSLGDVRLGILSVEAAKGSSSPGGGSEERPATRNKAVSDNPKAEGRQAGKLSGGDDFSETDRFGGGCRGGADFSQNSKVSSPVDRMTIFYGGKVVVYDDFPADKVNDLLAVAARRLPAVPTWNSPRRPSIIDPPAPSSDLPIARRVSLHRFLEKRKDRGPYPLTSSSSSPTAADDGGKWLVLGDLQR